MVGYHLSEMLQSGTPLLISRLRLDGSGTFPNFGVWENNRVGLGLRSRWVCLLVFTPPGYRTPAHPSTRFSSTELNPPCSAGPRGKTWQAGCQQGTTRECAMNMQKGIWQRTNTSASLPSEGWQLPRMVDATGFLPFRRSNSPKVAAMVELIRRKK